MRWIYRAGQNAHQSGHLLYGRAGHCKCRRHEESRESGRQSPALFRNRLYLCADHRAFRRECHSTGSGIQRESQHTRCECRCRLREARCQPEHGDFILHIIPSTFLDAFTGSGDLLQVLFVAILFGYAMTHMGATGKVVHQFIDACSHIFFAMMNTLMKLAPLGAGGAMAFTIGRYGLAALRPLAMLMGSFYLTCILFVSIVLGTIAALTGFNIFRFVAYISDEILTVLGTSSSESALVPLMQKLERLGCSKSVVGLVVPSGYSFNLDGTNIYLTMAALFVAQALNIDLTLKQQLTILGVAMLTSKGASGVTGAGFITLAATLAVVPSIPVAGLALILGIDRFMSEARSITNFIGNGVATVVVSHWERELDRKKLLDTLKPRSV